MDILLIVVGVVFCIIGLLLIALSVFILGVRYQAEKLIFGLPWLQWLTLDEVVAMGYSQFWCKLLLPAFYRNGWLEVRMQRIDTESFPEALRHAMREFPNLQEALDGVEIPFDYQTVPIHEFRITKRGRRRKKKFDFKSLLNPLSDWQPVPV